MKFAFLIHPITHDSDFLLESDPSGALRRRWGVDILGFCTHLHQAIEDHAHRNGDGKASARMVDELTGLLSSTGATAEGRLYQIPMGAGEILADPGRAMRFMEEAVDLAAAWGAEIVGLGSMTGIIGGQGTYLAERGPMAVTTGNCLTVYAALANLERLVQEVDIDLSRETVAVVGIPGSIASAVAALLAPRCRELLLVGRRASARATQLASQLDAELLFDIPSTLARARIILSATSTGHCIDQKLLLPGSVVLDIAVPADVQGSAALRDDVLVLAGGLSRLPNTMARHSAYLWFHHGVIPSCLAETMVLALEKRAECLSLGRNLSLERIAEIGAIAQAHGLDFSRYMSFGQPLEDSVLARFRKALHQQRPASPPTRMPTSTQKMAHHAARRHARHLNPVLMALGGPSDFIKTFVRGEGAYLWDDQGTRYLDFVAGFGALNLGHNHPAVVEAIADALKRQAPGFVQSAVNPHAAALAEGLINVAPRDLEMVFFCNSGTEAVEAALKLARAATGRSALLSCERSFHGKSLGALSVTGNRDYQRPFEPLLPDCATVPFGDLEALSRTLTARRFAGFIVEPLQAEGGMIVPPPQYLREAQALCRAAGTLLIVDEVQTGLGRTGALFAVEHDKVQPDVMTLAKSLGGGLMPLGAMLARRDAWLKAYGSAQTFALHTSTFGGGSLACAAGLATLKVLRDDNLVENAESCGRLLHQGLADLCRRCDIVREVRGRGLLLGLEFAPLPPGVLEHWKGADPTGLAPFLIPNYRDMVDSFAALYVMQVLLQAHHIYTQVTRSNPRVLRIQPPLIVNREQVEQFLGALTQTCLQLASWIEGMDRTIGKSGLGHYHDHGAETRVPQNGRL